MVDNKNSRANRRRKPTTTQRRGNPAWVPGMESPNPSGAPRRGQSWAEIINSVGDMTGPEAAQRAVTIAGQLRQLGDGVTLKEAVVIRAYADMLFDPKAGMWVAMMDRAEGKPNQPMSMEWRDRVAAMGLDPATVQVELRALIARLADQQRAAISAATNDDTPHD